MNARYITGGGSLLLLVGGLGFLVWAMRDRADAAQSLAQWDSKEALLQTGKTRALTALDDAKRSADSLQIALRAKLGAAGASKKARTGPPDWSAILARHPELQAAFERVYSAKQARDYTNLYQRLKLSQDQIDRLDLLMAKDFENNLDVQATARGQGLSMKDPSITQLIKQQQDELQSQEREVLDPQQYSAFQTFNSEEPARRAVKDAASFVATSATSFTADQEEQVVQLLAQTSPAFQSNAAKPLDLNTVNWDAALAQAQGFLSPAQIAALHAEAQLQPLQKLAKQFYSQQASPAK